MATRLTMTLAKWTVLAPALLLAAGCASQRKPVVAEIAPVAPLSVTPGTRALAVDEAGRQWDVTIQNAYYAASGRECLRVTLAQPTVPARGNGSVACAEGGRWVISPPLRSDDKTVTASLPTSFTFSP